jgi:hypothetical protein
MDLSIYCGINKLQKNKRLGSMKERAEKGQVSYWGLKKIDARLLASTKVSKKMSLDKTRMNKIKFDTRLKKLTKDYENEKDKTKKQTIKKNIEKTKKAVEKATKEYKAAFQLSEKKKASKKASKK